MTRPELTGNGWAGVNGLPSACSNSHPSYRGATDDRNTQGQQQEPRRPLLGIP